MTTKYSFRGKWWSWNCYTPQWQITRNALSFSVLSSFSTVLTEAQSPRCSIYSFTQSSIRFVDVMICDKNLDVYYICLQNNVNFRNSDRKLGWIRSSFSWILMLELLSTCLSIFTVKKSRAGKIRILSFRFFSFCQNPKILEKSKI